MEIVAVFGLVVLLALGFNSKTSLCHDDEDDEWTFRIIDRSSEYDGEYDDIP